MRQQYQMTRHAHERSTARSIPPLVAEIILDYGRPFDAGDGTRKYTLTKESMRNLRRAAGPAILAAVGPYRNRNAYVVEAGGRIITVAYSSTKLAD